MDFVYSDGAQRGHNWESFSETVTIISITNTHIKKLFRHYALSYIFRKYICWKSGIDEETCTLSFKMLIIYTIDIAMNLIFISIEHIYSLGVKYSSNC